MGSELVSKAVITKNHKFSGLEQKFMLSQFWKLEVEMNAEELRKKVLGT